MKVESWITGLKRMKLCQSLWASTDTQSVSFIHFEVVFYANPSLMFEVVLQPAGDRLDKFKMSELEQLRQEAEQLRSQIRVSQML